MPVEVFHPCQCVHCVAWLDIHYSPSAVGAIRVCDPHGDSVGAAGVASQHGLCATVLYQRSLATLGLGSGESVENAVGIALYQVSGESHRRAGEIVIINRQRHHRLEGIVHAHVSQIELQIIPSHFENHMDMLASVGVEGYACRVMISVDKGIYSQSVEGGHIGCDHHCQATIKETVCIIKLKYHIAVVGHIDQRGDHHCGGPVGEAQVSVAGVNFARPLQHLPAKEVVGEIGHPRQRVLNWAYRQRHRVVALAIDVDSMHRHCVLA